MGKKLLLIAGYFGFLPIVIFSLILYSLFLLHENSSAHNNISLFTKNVRFQALPQDKPETLIELASEDARISVLQEFFTRYKSPLLAHAEKIVKEADSHGLDYRLIPAIAMQESNVCKKIPEDSYNCWGFGIYGGKVTKFSDYNNAIEVVTESLSEDYAQQGYASPEAIMTKYTPSSNGSWAESVNYFMDKIHASL